MDIGNGELIHEECFPKTLAHGTARMKSDKETDDDGNRRGVSMKRRKAVRKKSDCLSLHNQNAIIINIICLYFIRYGKSSIKLTKNKIYLNNRKM